jgi:magnesium-transporting ATPase (P-type)
MLENIPFLSLSISAIAVMFYALFRALSLRNKVPGGKVKSTWNFLTFLVVLFAIGYLTTPFFSLLPAATKDLLVGFIFFFGAIFVVIVVNLFIKIVEDLGL